MSFRRPISRAFGSPSAGTAIAVPGGSLYTIEYEDFSGPEQAHAQARPFFCEQAVGDNPAGPWLALPFRKSFGFRSTPVIPGVGTLTVAVESGDLFEGVIWKNYNLTVFGEQNEMLGTLFTDPAHFLTFQAGGPVVDSIALSQEKMMAMSSDRDVVFHFVSSPDQPEGRLRIRWMRLDFSPAARYAGSLTTDNYFSVDETKDPANPLVTYKATFYTPPIQAGTPASDGVLTLTADANLAESYLELKYGDGETAQLFTDWVWGDDASIYQLSEPADVSEQCSGLGAYPSYSCTRASSIELNASRTNRHTAHYRIPRRVLTPLVEKGYLNLEISQNHSKGLKVSPLKLSYSLLNCHMMTIRAGQNMGAPLFRPSYNHFVFEGDAPPAAGAATLWIRASIQDHRLHVQGSPGVPYGIARNIKTDLGNLYTEHVFIARDPLMDVLPSRARWPHLGALRVLAGDQGQFINHVFLDDLSQYDELVGYVDSITIPLDVMVQFQNSRRISLTIEVPPGDGIVRIHSLVIAYPSTEA